MALDRDGMICFPGCVSRQGDPKSENTADAEVMEVPLSRGLPSEKLKIPEMKGEVSSGSSGKKSDAIKSVVPI